MIVIPANRITVYLASIKGHKGEQAVRNALQAWFAEVSVATWTKMQDIRDRYATASVINGERVVFNIKGNDYRLVARFDFANGIAQIRWIGTHAEYNAIDVSKV